MTTTLTIDPGYSGGSIRTVTMTSGTTNNNDIGSLSRDGYMLNGYRAVIVPANDLYPKDDLYPGGIKIFDEAGRAIKSAGYWSDKYPGGTWQRNVDVTVVAEWMKVRRHVRVLLKEDEEDSLT